jgi:hypothetical protein
MKLFEYDVHLGGYKVLVQTRDVADNAISSKKIAPKAITLDKLADEIIQMILTSDGGGVIDLSTYAKKTDLDAVELSLVRKADKSELTELMQAVRAAINGIFVKVEELPDASEDTLHKIYLVPTASENVEDSDLHDEFITVLTDNEGYAWERIGNTRINLDGYLQESDLAPIHDQLDLLEEYKARKADTLAGYGINNAYTKGEVDALMEGLTGAGELNAYQKKIGDVSLASGAIQAQEQTDGEGKKSAVISLVGHLVSSLIFKSDQRTNIEIDPSGTIGFTFVDGTSVLKLLNAEGDTLSIYDGSKTNRIIHGGDTVWKEIKGKVSGKEIALKSEIPDISGKADKSELFSGSYNDLEDKPTIPSAPDLSPYALKSEIPDVSGKADKMEIVQASGTSLQASVGKYYRFDDEVSNLVITLPTVSSNLTETVVISLTTGENPTITFNNANVKYFKGFVALENTQYEINCMWNGKNWIVAYGVVM